MEQARWVKPPWGADDPGSGLDADLLARQSARRRGTAEAGLAGALGRSVRGALKNSAPAGARGAAKILGALIKIF